MPNLRAGQRVLKQRIRDPVKKSDFSHSMESGVQKGWLYGKENCTSLKINICHLKLNSEITR